MNLRVLLFCAGVAIAMNACSSGSSTIPSPSVSATPSAAPTGPATVSQATTVSTVAGQSIAAPVVQGYAPTITTPALSVPLTGNVTASTDVPAGIATFDVLRATTPLGNRQIAAKPDNAKVLLYVNIVPTVTTVASGDIAFSFALPNPPTGINAYYLALFDGHTWHTDYLTAPGKLTDKGVAFPSVTLPAPVTLIAGSRYAIALYSVPSNATPAPEVLLAPIAAKPPAGSPPLASSLGTQQFTLDPAKAPQSLANLRLLAGVASVQFPTPTANTALSYNVVDGFPTEIKINDPPEDGVVQGILAVTPATDLTFVKGSKIVLKYTPDSGVVQKYDLGLIVGKEAITGGTQTNDGGTASISYELPQNITFPAATKVYVGFGLSDGGFHNDDNGQTNKGNNQNNGGNNQNPGDNNPNGFVGTPTGSNSQQNPNSGTVQPTSTPKVNN